MSRKKLILIVAGVAAGLVLLAALFIGAIAGFVFYTIGSSEAAETAREFLRTSERLRQETGEVRDFGSIVTGTIREHEAGGSATLNFKVVGALRTINASVNLIYKEAYGWRVVGGSYRNDAGRTIELLDSYGTAPEEVEVEEGIAGEGEGVVEPAAGEGAAEGAPAGEGKR
jgi:hypothetical protein